MKTLARSDERPEDDEEEGGNTPQQRAFIRSAAPGNFLGKELAPFDVLRMTAAIKMGLKFGFVTSDDLRESIQVTEVDVPIKGKKGKTRKEFKEVKQVIYEDILGDVTTVLWLCLNPHSVALRARRDRKRADEALIEASRWATKLNIRFGHPNFEKAAIIFGEIMEDIQASHSEPDPETGAEGDPGN